MDETVRNYKLAKGIWNERGEGTTKFPGKERDNVVI